MSKIVQPEVIVTWTISRFPPTFWWLPAWFSGLRAGSRRPAPSRRHGGWLPPTAGAIRFAVREAEAEAAARAGPCTSPGAAAGGGLPKPQDGHGGFLTWGIPKNLMAFLKCVNGSMTWMIRWLWGWPYLRKPSNFRSQRLLSEKVGAMGKAYASISTGMEGDVFVERSRGVIGAKCW